MDKTSLKAKTFLNLLGTYKEVRQVADITTTGVTPHFSTRENLLKKILRKDQY